MTVKEQIGQEQLSRIAGDFSLKLAASLRKFRIERGLSQYEAAASLKIDRSTLAYYELGKVLPSIGRLDMLAILYGVSIGEILENEDFSYYNQRKKVGTDGGQRKSGIPSKEMSQRNACVDMEAFI